MTYTAGGCRDLRQYMNDPKTLQVFGKLISGRTGYTPVEERRVEQLFCSGCHIPLTGDEKFCQECGTKVEKKEKKE
ncbi:MAG: hypothetical protein WC475_05055 [Candidatus Paceibacterota bacterium]